MTASEVRRNWFRVLDEVIAGEVIIIERKGRRVMLRRESGEESMSAGLPDYAALIEAKVDIEGADAWGWEWDPDSGDLTPNDDGDA